MTEQEIRIAIAGAVGWTRIRKGRYDSILGTPPGFQPETTALVPDYANDADAMYTAELKCYSDRDWFDADEWIEINRVSPAMRATNKDRVHAFMHILNLWKPTDSEAGKGEG